jgi:transposase
MKENLIIKLLTFEIKSVKKLYKSFDYSCKKQKYSLSDYLKEILYVLKTGIAWRDIRSEIYWNSIYKTYIKLNKFKIFQISYVSLLKKYLKKSPNKKLKFIYTDTTFVPNKKGKDLIGYNKFYNRKKGTKISIITDAKGSAINVKLYDGRKYDSQILLDHLENRNLVQIDHIHSNHKQIFMADAGYDTKEIRDKLKQLKYTIMIPQNKRNIKNTELLRKFTKKEKELYNKRSIIERTFNKMKYNRRICTRYESKSENFLGFVYMALIKSMI